MKKIVRICLLVISVSLGFIFLCGSIQKVSATSVLFDRPLMIGSQGKDVYALQKILNEDPATRIQGTGPGSPGKETSYFGYLTQNAVIRFQDKYANEILAPAGLTQGSGYVGYYTMDKLNALSTVNPTSQTVPLAASSTVLSQNPNLAHLNEFIAAIDALGKKQGMDATKLISIEKAIRTTAASSTTDFRKEFLKEAPLAISGTAYSSMPGFSGIIRNVLVSLGLVHVAEAGSGVPFGGALTYAIPCTCAEGVWYIFIRPLPPSYAMLLSYETGTQLFASYNTPMTTELLGFYTPGPPACWFYAGVTCAFPPQEGLISPILGSAP